MRAVEAARIHPQQSVTLAELQKMIDLLEAAKVRKQEAINGSKISEPEAQNAN